MLQSVDEALISLKVNRRAAIRLNLSEINGNESIIGSKIGGVPYWEKSKTYPVHKGQALHLLAQINWTELRKSMPEFAVFGTNMPLPEKGITQFFIDTHDLMLGLDPEVPNKQTGWRVIHWENPDENNSAPIPNDALTLGEYAPFFGAKQIKFSPVYMSPGPSDAIEFPELGPMDENLIDRLSKGMRNDGSHVAGFPENARDDVRLNGDDKEFFGHRLLLQLDNTSGLDFGPLGSAQWFIHPANLSNLDFSNVVFDWDHE